MMDHSMKHVHDIITLLTRQELFLSPIWHSTIRGLGFSDANVIARSHLDLRFHTYHFRLTVGRANVVQV